MAIQDCRTVFKPAVFALAISQALLQSVFAAPIGALAGDPGLQTFDVCPTRYPEDFNSNGNVGIEGSQIAPWRIAPRPVRQKY